jgi:chromosome partitioning protein
MDKLIKDMQADYGEGILKHGEGLEILPANINLSGVEMALVNTMSRETILKQYIDMISREYDYIIIDTCPSLGMLTLNALAAANSVIIPVQAQYLSLKGLEQLLQTIAKIKRKINPGLSIEGILITMTDTRTNYNKDIIALLEESYKEKIKIFCNNIPQSVRASETSAAGISIYAHNPNGKAALAYEALTMEVLNCEK